MCYSFSRRGKILLIIKMFVDNMQSDRRNYGKKTLCTGGNGKQSQNVL